MSSTAAFAEPCPIATPIPPEAAEALSRMPDTLQARLLSHVDELRQAAQIAPGQLITSKDGAPLRLPVPPGDDVDNLLFKFLFALQREELAQAAAWRPRDRALTRRDRHVISTRKQILRDWEQQQFMSGFRLALFPDQPG